MSIMPSQITGHSSVWSTFISDKQHRNIKGPYYRPFVKGIHRWRVDSSHKGELRKIRFHLMTLICSQSPFLYKRPDALTRSAATLSLDSEIEHLGHIIGIHIKSTPNKHVEQKWWETSGKYLRKWPNLRPELWSIWGPKWPGKWASGANIQHTSKSSSNWREREDWSETSRTFLIKWPRPEFFTYFGAQSGPKIGPLMPIFFHTFKSTCNEHVKQYCCETSETFWESDQTPEIWLTLGPKMGHKLGLWGTSLKVAPISI